MAVCEVLPPDVGDETREYAALELDHVGRRDIVGDHDKRILATEIARRGPRRLQGRRCAARQNPEHPFHQLFQIGLALPKVFILHLVELACQHFQLRR